MGICQDKHIKRTNISLNLNKIKTTQLKLNLNVIFLGNERKGYVLMKKFLGHGFEKKFDDGKTLKMPTFGGF